MSYTIAFYIDSVQFGPGEVSGEKSLGGSESSCIGTARALQARGHRVHLFTSKLSPECRGTDRWGVSWHHADELREVSRLFEWDVFCSLRMPSPFVMGIKARLRILWNQDLMNADPFKTQIMSVAWAFDKLAYVSEFHQVQWLDWIPELKGIGYVTRNGFDPTHLPTSSTKDPNRIIHISRPERGLTPLLQMWPAIREANPWASLKLCRYSSMYDTGQGSWSEVCADFDRKVARMAQTVGGIEYLGELGKADLYQAIADSAVMWYPGVPTFAETSCVAAVEAQACGTPFVGSYKGALPETIPSGILIVGDAYSPEYQAESVKQVLDLMKGCKENTFKYRQLVKEGRTHVEGYTFAAIAGEWEAEIDRTFKDRYEGNKHGVLRSLLHYDDHTAAKQVARDILAGCKDTDVEAQAAYDLCVRVIAGKEHTAEQYASHALDPLFEIRHEANARGRMVADTFKDCTHVLDVACGPGAFALMMLEANPNLHVTAIDYAQGNIDAATKAAQELGLSDRATFICQPVWDFDRGTFSDWWTGFAAAGRRFNGLWCGEFVEHIADCSALIDGLESQCQIGAKVLMTVPSGPMVEYNHRNVPWDRGHVHHFCHDDLVAVWGVKDPSFDYLAWPNPTNVGNAAGNWVIAYRASETKIGTRDYAHRIVTTRPKGTLSVGILTYNSEHDILRCLDSVWALADEIIIGDTGSLDTTKQIVEGIRKVKVIDLPSVQNHPDGFAGVRNEVLKHATQEWFLWIDTDEVMVGGHALQKYLDASVYQGFAVSQNHLQMDAPMHADHPVRIFRRRPEIQFYGCVHEQPQWGDCNGDIIPALQIHDVQLAHTGYLVEGVRRIKMADRNFPLLVRDRQRFPDRELGKVLVLRDLVNLANYQGEMSGGYTVDCFDYFKRAIALFEAELKDPGHRYHQIARPWYEQALKALELGIEVELALGVKPGGLNGERPKSRRLWVREPQDLERLMAWQTAEITKQLLPKPLRVEPLPKREAVSA